MYVSNQRRLKINTADRRNEEKNGNIQQMRVYQALAEKYGDLETSTNLAKMAGNVFEQIGSQPDTLKKVSTTLGKGFDLIVQAVKNGSLDKLFKVMKEAPTSTPTGQLVQQVIKTPGYIKSVNDNLKQLVDQGEKQPRVFASALLTELTNSKMFKDRVKSGDLDIEAGSVPLTAENLAQAGLSELAANSSASSVISETKIEESTVTPTMAENFRGSSEFPKDLPKLSNTGGRALAEAIESARSNKIPFPVYKKLTYDLSTQPQRRIAIKISQEGCKLVLSSTTDSDSIADSSKINKPTTGELKTMREKWVNKQNSDLATLKERVDAAVIAAEM